MITYRTLLEKISRISDCPPQAGGRISHEDAQNFTTAWRNVVTKVFGATDFRMTVHFLQDRMNSDRNVEPISTCELSMMLNQFFAKNRDQFKKDVKAVKDGTAIARGKNTHKIPKGEMEFVITSKSRRVNLVLALRPERGRNRKGTAVLLPVTVQRKKPWNVTKGEQFFVEGVGYSTENVYEVG